MIPSGKCPKCEKSVMHVTVEDLPIHVGFEPRWKGAVYLCPHCKSILSVGIDPIAIKTDILKALGK